MNEPKVRSNVADFKFTTIPVNKPGDILRRPATPQSFPDGADGASGDDRDTKVIKRLIQQARNKTATKRLMSHGSAHKSQRTADIMRGMHKRIRVPLRLHEPEAEQATIELADAIKLLTKVAATMNASITWCFWMV